MLCNYGVFCDGYTQRVALHTSSTKMEMKRAVANVSVVIPCYCCSRTIGRALTSIAAQTLLPKEVILVEDSSPDNGATLRALYEEVAKYVDNFDIKVVALAENKGAANARNVGWDLATQPYIALLDADDAWHPKKIEIQYQFMQNTPDVVLCGHDKKILSVDAISQWALDECKWDYLTRRSILLSNPFVTPSVMIRNDINLRFNPLKRYVDDHLLWLEIAFQNYNVAKLSPALVAVYKPMYGESGLSSNMWDMEKSELDNYWILLKSGKVSLIITAILCWYSLAKYFRRLVIVNSRRIFLVKR